MSNLKFDATKKIKHFRYSCVRCFYTIDDDESRMKNHCLTTHGDSGQFHKAYKKTRRYRK